MMTVDGRHSWHRPAGQPAQRPQAAPAKPAAARRSRKVASRALGPFAAAVLVLGFSAVLAPGLNVLWSMGYAVVVTTGLLFALYTFVSFVLPNTYSPATESTGVTSTWPGSFSDGRARPAPALPSVLSSVWEAADDSPAARSLPSPGPRLLAATTTAAVFLPIAVGAPRPLATSPAGGRDVSLR